MASRTPEAHAAQDPLETMEIPTEPPTADPRTDEQRRGNLLQEYEQQLEQLSDAQKLSKLCTNAGLKTVEREQYFITLDTERTERNGTKIGPVLNIHVCHHEDRYCTEIQVSASRQNHLLRSDCEWNRKVRKRNDGNHGRRRAWSFR